jgi:hypothetical protein
LQFFSLSFLKIEIKTFVYLSVNEVHGELESDGSHVCALEGGREVEVEVQQLVHAAVLFNLKKQKIYTLNQYQSIIQYPLQSEETRLFHFELIPIIHYRLQSEETRLLRFEPILKETKIYNLNQKQKLSNRIPLQSVQTNLKKILASMPKLKQSVC